jgi:outer membrane protein OmpA-like peptidoglycan-associated protein
MSSAYRGLVLSSIFVALLASGCTWFSRSSEPRTEAGVIDSPGADVTFANDQKKARDEAAKAATPETDSAQGGGGAPAGDKAAGGATVTPLPADSDSTSGGGGAMADKDAGSAPGATANGDLGADGKAMQPRADAGADAMVEKVTLQGDALFQFGKADESGMLPGGKQRLDEVADRIMAIDASTIAGIAIVGHADRLGSPTGNMKISAKRAATVMNYLARRGVDAGMMESMGKGDSDPIMECPGARANKALIACLSPNRRVDVIINTK